MGRFTADSLKVIKNFNIGIIGNHRFPVEVKWRWAYSTQNSAQGYFAGSLLELICLPSPISSRTLLSVCRANCNIFIIILIPQKWTLSYQTLNIQHLTMHLPYSRSPIRDEQIKQRFKSAELLLYIQASPNRVKNNYIHPIT